MQEVNDLICYAPLADTLLNVLLPLVTGFVLGKLF